MTVLRKLMAECPLPVIPSEDLQDASAAGFDAFGVALELLNELNLALAAADVTKLKDLFFPGQAYWRDQLALTYHLRTFMTPSIVAASLLETCSLRGLNQNIRLEGSPQLVLVTPVLQFINCDISFRTSSPEARCLGKILLLPSKKDGVLRWKIWTLSTWLDSLDIHPEDPSILLRPGRSMSGVDTIETDVFIIGGGNAAIALAARLKALGVDNVIAERDIRVGDNWANRYDCMKFHVPTSFCNMPYMDYAEELQNPHLLTKDDLAKHLQTYADTFNLNIITSAKILSTAFDASSANWIAHLSSPSGNQKVVSKHLVQATGIGSQKPNMPNMKNEQLFEGIKIHSSDFKSGKMLAKDGVKSVVIVGSANTAFDVLEDCHSAGLETTMVVRSPTYVVPLEYIRDKRSLGVYDLDVDASDRLLQTLPTVVDSQLACGLLGMLASHEPDRYKSLEAAGFPVLDSAHPDANLSHHLLERAGGHYVDIGGTQLIVEGKTSVKSNVEPVAYTVNGLRLSDGAEVKTDAVVWCTGFADQDVRRTCAEILGGNVEAHDIASRIETTWGSDAEGEIRGMWKRHIGVENYWVMGGFTSQHRWHSRTLALQIKAAIEGILPPAYRETPNYQR